MHLDEQGQPCWHDGDVVRIQFKRKRTNDLSKEYEYVRRDGYWPGEAGWWSNKTDAEMTEAWHEGRLGALAMTAAPEPGPSWPSQHIEPGVNGVWVAYHRLDSADLRVPSDDFVVDGCVLFLDELAAYRYAATKRPARWTVGFVTWGTPVAETYPADEFS